jgi:hypothetical protein
MTVTLKKGAMLERWHKNGSGRRRLVWCPGYYVVVDGSTQHPPLPLKEARELKKRIEKEKRDGRNQSGQADG